MNRPWMPLNIADYLRDTSHLRAEESGAYLHLIMAYWVSGKLPNDDRQLATIAKLSDRAWKTLRPCLEAFFGDGFSSHKRIDKELSKVAEISSKRRSAVQQREIKRRSNDPSSDDTLNTIQSKKDSEAKASDAKASDPRSDLFGRGLKALALMTGKTPDSCRSLVGKWLKAVNDEAIHVLGAIDDAERNRVADPVAWIGRSLQPKQGNRYGQANPNGLSRALAGLREHVGDIERGEEGGVPAPRLLSHR